MAPGDRVRVKTGHHASRVYRLSPRLDGKAGTVVKVSEKYCQACVLIDKGPRQRAAKEHVVELSWLEAAS